jgi:hypothetical protein
MRLFYTLVPGKRSWTVSSNYNSLRALCDLGPEFQDLWPLLHSHELEKEKVTADRLTETGIYITHRPPGRASAEKEDNQESYCRTID